jgi:hypothetical protein
MPVRVRSLVAKKVAVATFSGKFKSLLSGVAAKSRSRI